MTSKQDQEKLTQQAQERNEERGPDYMLFFAKVIAILGLPLLIIAVLCALWSYDAVIMLKVLFPTEDDYLAGGWAGTIPEGMQPDYLYAYASKMHDLGIILSTLGLIFLFVTATYIVRELLARPRMPQDSENYAYWFFKWSDTFFVIISVLLLFAWAGIWVFIHQAYVLELEVWRGSLTNPSLYAFGGFSSPNLIRLGIVIEIITIFILGIFIYGFLKREEMIGEPPLALGVSPKRIEWRGLSQITYINSDWIFYFVVFMIYILIAFGLWIFLFEGFFATANDVAIIWALITITPGQVIILPHEPYYYAGIVLVVSCFFALLILMSRTSRNPKYKLESVPKRRYVIAAEFAARMKQRGRWLAAVILFQLLFLGAGIALFLIGFYLIPVNELAALTIHILGRRIVFLWAIIMVILIITERSGERIRLEDQASKSISEV